MGDKAEDRWAQAALDLLGDASTAESHSEAAYYHARAQTYALMQLAHELRELRRTLQRPQTGGPR